MQPAGNWPIKDRPIKKALANVLHSTSAFAPQVPRSAAGEPTTYGLIPHICGTALTGRKKYTYQPLFLAIKEKKIIKKTLANVLHSTSAFAPQVGLEPTTYGLTVRRSNRLSY